MARAWSAEDERRLAFDWGVFRIETIAHRLGRTRDAVIQRAAKLQLGPASRGTTTLKAISDSTGYDRKQVRSAARALGIHIGRRVTKNIAKVEKKRFTSIDEDQAERIIAFLKARPDGTPIRFETKGAWGEKGRGGVLKPTHCVVCGKNDRPHWAKGKCHACYERARAQRKRNCRGDSAGC